VHRREPSLVVPTAPTPRETKHLSDTGDHEFLCMLVLVIFFYRSGLLHANPTSVIHSVLAEALVSYYPLARRVLQVEGLMMVVECISGGCCSWRPLFPWMDQLLFDVKGCSGLLNCFAGHLSTFAKHSVVYNNR
jgi:hypothetical protein